MEDHVDQQGAGQRKRDRALFGVLVSSNKPTDRRDLTPWLSPNRQRSSSAFRFEAPLQLLCVVPISFVDSMKNTRFRIDANRSIPN